MMFDTEAFILEVYKEDSIWNIKSKVYHDRVQKYVSWTKVAKAMFGNYDELSEPEKNAQILDLQKKWKNLKDNFRRKCVKKSGMAAKENRTYIYGKVLEFLRPTMENRKTISNISDESSDENSESDLQDVGDQIHSTSTKSITEFGNIDDSQDIDIEYSSPAKKKKNKNNEKKNKKKNTLTFEDQLLSYLHQPQDNDPDKLFLLSLLPQIKQIPQDKKNQFFIYMLNGIQKFTQTSNSSNYTQIQSPTHSQTCISELSPKSQTLVPSVSSVPHSQVQNIISSHSPYPQSILFSPVPQRSSQNDQNLNTNQHFFYDQSYSDKVPLPVSQMLPPVNNSSYKNQYVNNYDTQLIYSNKQYDHDSNTQPQINSHPSPHLYKSKKLHLHSNSDKNQENHQL